MWERRCGWWLCDDMCSGHVRYLPSSCVWAGYVCTWSMAADLVHRQSRLHCVSLRHLISPLKFTLSPSLTHLFHFSPPFSPYDPSPFSSFLPLSLTIASSPLHLPLSLSLLLLLTGEVVGKHIARFVYPIIVHVLRVYFSCTQCYARNTA